LYNALRTGTRENDFTAAGRTQAALAAGSRLGDEHPGGLEDGEWAALAHEAGGVAVVIAGLGGGAERRGRLYDAARAGLGRSVALDRRAPTLFHTCIR
jgi:hypothetical protein